ncbi:MAG: helix-turn-helix transcriptional regulator [Candidatus Omnitrophica bacterium]|nr:helix-turn-helix transcriptional regulator [Candidatus Omnitrophota bacterium]
MSISKYFWDINENALKETAKILENPKHPQFPVKMVIFLSRCDKPKELFSLITKAAFIDAWPKIRAQWIKRARQSDFRDWWETIYEQLAGGHERARKKPASITPIFFRKFGALIKEARIRKGLSQKQLAHRIGMKQPDVSRIEEGRKNITLYTVMRFCNVLGIKKIAIIPE